MPVIVTSKPAAPARVKPAETVEPDDAEAMEEREAIESPVAATSRAMETAVAVEKSRRPGPLAGAMGRERYIGPGAASGKVPVVGAEARQGDRKKADGSGERARPAVKLAPMPKSRQPSPQQTAAEPPAQKPDLRLPADVMGAGKQGAKPLAAHLRRHEKTLDEEKKQRGLKGLRPPGTPAPVAAPETEEERRGKGRHRRGKETPADGEEGGGPMLGGREQRQLARRRTTTTGESEDRPHRAFGRR